MQQRIFATRRPQRRAVRTAEHEVTSVFPAIHSPAAPAAAGDDVDELLAAIDAVLSAD